LASFGVTFTPRLAAEDWVEASGNDEKIRWPLAVRCAAAGSRPASRVGGPLRETVGPC